MSIVATAESRLKHYVEREERIIQAAMRIFSSRNYRAATITMIAKEACVNEATIYKHFRTKRDLYRACWERVTGIMTQALNNITYSAGNIDMEATIKEQIRLLNEDPDAASLLIQMVSLYTEPDLEDLHNEAIHGRIDFMVGIVEEAKKAGGIRKDLNSVVVALTILGFMWVSVIAKPLGYEERWDKEAASEALAILAKSFR